MKRFTLRDVFVTITLFAIALGLVTQTKLGKRIYQAISIQSNYNIECPTP